MHRNHEVNVVEVNLEKHPFADRLSLVKVGGYTVVVNTEQWTDKKFGAYIPPESIVPQNETFKFLGDKPNHYIIKAKKIRGINSFGMLVPLPPGNWSVGDNVAEPLGIKHYDPPEPLTTTGGQCCKPPDVYAPKYDVVQMKKYPDVFQKGEPVWVTEKLHGCNARYTNVQGEMFCGSRNEWKKGPSVFHSVLNNSPALQKAMTENPDMVFYGEIVGRTQNLQYSLPGNKFFLFDIMKDQQWFNARQTYEFAKYYQIDSVPVLNPDGIPFDFEYLLNLIEKNSWLDKNQLMEGVVIKPVVEQYSHVLLGRKQLKLVSMRYYEKT